MADRNWDNFPAARCRCFIVRDINKEIQNFQSQHPKKLILSHRFFKSMFYGCSEELNCNLWELALVTLDWIRGRRPALTSLLCISPASDTRRPGARCRPGHSMSRHLASLPHSAATNKHHQHFCQTYFRLHQASAEKVGLRTGRLAFFELLTEPKTVFMIDT